MKLNKDISTEELEKKIADWRLSMVEDINNNFRGKSYLQADVAAASIKSLVDDVHVLMQWVEILAKKVKDLESNI